MNPKFDVKILKLAKAFLNEIPQEASEKVVYNIEKAKFVNDPELFKKLRNDIWEFRTKHKGIQYRVLAFWDKRNKQDILVVCSSGFVKKRADVPGSEIDKAEKIKKLYFDNT